MKTKDYKGITLIALIITIIVLLILAGVSISLVVGDNGVLGQAINATTATDIADVKEQIELGVIGYLDTNGDYTLADVEQAVSDAGATLDGTTVTTAKGNTFDISDLIDGAIVSWSYDDDGNVTNGSVTLAIGDYVNYDPGDYTYTSSSDVNGYADQVFNTSSYVYSWRVLGADEETGELLIISDDLIGPDSGGYTDSTYNRTYFYLKGQAGYANCESELNAICAIYGNGTGATGARSINVDDINKITGYDPDTAAYGSGNIYAYGNEVTYTYNTSSKTDYSWSGGSGTGSGSFTYYTGTAWKKLASGEDVTLTSTYYFYYPNTLTNSSSGDTVGISTTSTEYYMLFTNSSTGAYSSGANTTSGFYYWLASPCVMCQSGCANFYCRCIYRGSVGSSNENVGRLLNSLGSITNAGVYGVRAVVSLGSDVSLEWNDSTSEWEIQ